MNFFKIITGIIFFTILFSCGSKQSILILNDFSATVTFSVTIDESVAKKIISFQGLSNTTKVPMFFDAVSITENLKKMVGCTIQNIKQESPYAVSGKVSFKDIRTIFTKKPTDKITQSFIVTQTPGKAQITIKIDKTNAKTVQDMFPGLDQAILEALAPPSIEAQEMSEAEYLEMLKNVIGSRNIPAIQSAMYDVTLTLPGTILSQTGGTQQGNTVSFKIPILKALVLEKPLEFSVAWAIK